MRLTDRRRGPQAAQFIHSLNSSSHNLEIDSEMHLRNGGSEVGNGGLVELAFLESDTPSKLDVNCTAVPV